MALRAQLGLPAGKGHQFAFFDMIFSPNRPSFQHFSIQGQKTTPFISHFLSSRSFGFSPTTSFRSSLQKNVENIRTVSLCPCQALLPGGSGDRDRERERERERRFLSGDFHTFLSPSDRVFSWEAISSRRSTSQSTTVDDDVSVSAAADDDDVSVSLASFEGEEAVGAMVADTTNLNKDKKDKKEREGKVAYGADQIQVLEGLEPVRKRPGMYIGSTGPRGLHHLVYEVVDNAIDEAQAGYATNIWVELKTCGSVSVTDNGRGIPVDLHPSTGKSSLETVLTILHAGGKFGGERSGYSVSGGLHGVGISVVNALSEELEATVWRDKKKYQQTFQKGKPIGEISRKSLSKVDEKKTGTQIVFRPDPSIFTTTTQFDFSTITTRLRELAFLNPQVAIEFREDDENPEKVRTSKFHFVGGLEEYVKWLTADKEPLHEPITFQKEVEGIIVNVALQWCSDAYSDTLLGYANSIRTTDGGTHIDGMKSAITRTLNSLGRKTKILKEKDESLSGEHVREGLTCIVSVKVPNPEFEGQTKTRLGNPRVRKVVDQTVAETVTEYLDLHPSACEAILNKAIQAYRAAQAAKKARELVRRKSVLKSSMLPGKLSDCSCSDPMLSEIFLVEGDSAGGSAKQGRDRRFQAVLPLRGKILNIERKDDAAIYKNQEIQNLILGLGLGIKGEEFQENILRYGKIIILTDADVDGAHIRTLLLTFLFRYQKALFERGHIYVGVPPLYKVERGRSSLYCYNEEELQAHLKTLPPNASINIQRFKGLGEMMPEQLWQTTLNPKTRMLRQLTVDEAAEANVILSMLMGDKVGPRKELIKNMGSRMKLESLDI